MKKNYLLAGALISTFAINAQIVSSNKVENFRGERVSENNSAQFGAKALGTTLWSNDFSTSTDWTVVDSAGHTAGDWTIVTALPTALSEQSTNGNYSFATVLESTSMGEFALVNSDAVGAAGVQKTYFESGNIALETLLGNESLTGSSAVSISWYEIYRHFREKNFIEVSNDAGATWTQYQVNDVGVNVDSQGADGNPGTEQESITIEAPTGGWSDTSRIRFYYEGAYDWFWAIDDISISTLPTYDLKEQVSYWGTSGLSFTDGGFFPFQYSRVPLSQVQAVDFGAKVLNQGADNLTNVTLNVNYTGGGDGLITSTPVASLSPFAEDSISASFTPVTEDTYTFTVTYSQTETDDIAANNQFGEVQNLVVGGDIMAKDYGTTFGQGGGGADTDQNGELDSYAYEAGNFFQMGADGIVSNIELGIGSASLNEGKDIYGILYSYDGSTYTSVETTDLYTVKADDLGKVIKLPFLSSASVSANGLYFAAIGVAEEFNYATAGQSEPQTSLISYPTMGASDPYRLYLGGVPIIRLDFGTSIAGINENSANVGLEVYPNPAVNNVNVEFSLDNETAVELSISDLSGKVVYTNNLGNVAAGSHKVNVETAGLSNGVYMYTFAAGNTVVTEKLVIKK